MLRCFGCPIDAENEVGKEAPGYDVAAAATPNAAELKVRSGDVEKQADKGDEESMEAKRDADFFLFIELDLRTLSPNFYLLTNIQARETYKNYIGGGNCTPPHVRRLVNPNDFSALDGEAHS
jgi:hypothetical protein